jgi:hypothetical protein
MDKTKKCSKEFGTLLTVGVAAILILTVIPQAVAGQESSESEQAINEITESLFDEGYFTLVETETGSIYVPTDKLINLLESKSHRIVQSHIKS